MPKKDHYVIIGNGPAGNRVADVLRENDNEARVTIVSDESFCYYYRHKLPQFVAGKIDEESLRIRPYSVYKEQNIRMRLGQRVERIDPDEKMLYLKHMEMVSFTKLILAVGGTPRIPPTLARFENSLTFMSRYSDAIEIRPKLEKSKKIFVLGGDLTSLGFIKQLIGLKKEIVFFLNRESFWPFELTQEMADSIRSSLKKKNVETIVDDGIESISRKKNAYTITMESDKTFIADMVCCFTGLVPNIQFIIGSGIDTERGVLVDDNLRTNYKDIYACGDCAQIYNPELKSYWVSIGWQNAELQGEIAALNLLGDQKVIKPLPKKVLEVEGIKVNTSWWKGF